MFLYLLHIACIVIFLSHKYASLFWIGYKGSAKGKRDQNQPWGRRGNNNSLWKCCASVRAWFRRWLDSHFGTVVRCKSKHVCFPNHKIAYCTNRNRRGHIIMYYYLADTRSFHSNTRVSWLQKIAWLKLPAWEQGYWSWSKNKKARKSNSATKR